MYKIKDTKLNIIKADITEMETEAIVNAANNTLLGGGGVDGAIHRKGGPKILEQCKKIGGCPTGEARITVGGDLKADYVIHTVGPIYEKSSDRNRILLYKAYKNSLGLLKSYGLNTISFPSISTGAYKYPIEEAVEVAYEAINDFIEDEGGIREINFVLFSDDDLDVYLKYFEKVLG